MPFVKGQKPTQGFFFDFPFFLQVSRTFLLPRQNHHHVSISEHAARKASGKGRARRSVSVNRGVERYNRLYFEPCSHYRHSLIHLSVVERTRESNRLTLTTTHLLSASTLGPWCASYCSIRERTFRRGLRSLCRVLAKRIFVGETVGRALTLVL